MTSNYKIRTATKEDIAFAVSLAKAEGWNPGLRDEEAFYNADPNGFLVGTLNGELIACISAVSYKNSFGFIGFYIVVPKHRGKGYGLKIWNAAVEKLSGLLVGLDGVVDQQDNYKKSGFQFAYKNRRFHGVSRKLEKRSDSLRQYTSKDWNNVIAFDREYFPADRSRFLSKWLTLEGHQTLLYKHEDKLLGYGTIRPCDEGYKIGPLFANTPDTAEAILTHLIDLIPEGQAYYLDVPDPNKDAMQLAEKFTMQEVFETARMYQGKAPSLSVDRTYGVTTFELG